MAGFLVSIPVKSSATVPSTTVVPVTQRTTATGSVLDPIGPTSLAPHSFGTSFGAQLSVGTDVMVTWSSFDDYGDVRSVDVYVFDSSQLRQYFQNGTTSPNIASQTGQSSGTIGFHVSVADTYTLVLYNPHSAWPVIWVNASGTETYPTTTTTYTTQTFISTTTKNCSHQLWNWLFGARSCR